MNKDFNLLFGSLPTELFRLTTLTQLDLNNNRFSGDIAQMGVFEDLEFLQLHSNQFTGMIPPSMGALSRMGTFTLHQNFFVGTMPESVCDLVNINGTSISGSLVSLIADCDPPANDLNAPPKIVCPCCTDCRES